MPSNLILERVGARRWIARIMIGWGVVSMAMMFVHDVWSFYLLRVLLGIAEAGFFPGVILYLTYWVPAAHRARTSALFMMAIPISVIVGAPVSEALLKLDGTLGAARLAVAVPARGTAGRARSAWRRCSISPTTRRRRRGCPSRSASGCRRRWRASGRERVARGHGSALASLRSGKVWLLCAIYFMNTLVTYGVFLWLPRILKEAAGPRRRRSAC